MQRLNSFAIAVNGADGIPSVIGHTQTRNDSISVTTGTRSNADEQLNESSTAKEFKELSTTIQDHGNKMVSAAKMKCVQREKELNYAMHAEICSSLHTLNAEKRQTIIQMHVEKVKKNRVMEQVYSDAVREIEQKVAEEEARLNQTVTTRKSQTVPLHCSFSKYISISLVST